MIFLNEFFFDFLDIEEGSIFCGILRVLVDICGLLCLMRRLVELHLEDLFELQGLNSLLDEVEMSLEGEFAFCMMG